jgi:hypothetical protein
MPSSWLSVPHFQQEHEYSCVAACARMVLAHFGDIRTESELRSLLDTQPTGTRAGNLLVPFPNFPRSGSRPFWDRTSVTWRGLLSLDLLQAFRNH